MFSRELSPDERGSELLSWYEFDLWPRDDLCLEHHREWHTRMTGYDWHRRRGAA